jgi:hypothetical protein
MVPPVRVWGLAACVLVFLTSLVGNFYFLAWGDEKVFTRTRCSEPHVSSWGNFDADRNFLSYQAALKLKTGDFPDIRPGKASAVHVPRLQTVYIIGKGPTMKTVAKNSKNLIVTLNHAVLMQEHVDIHFQTDYLFEDFPSGVFSKVSVLVFPTYFHLCRWKDKKCSFVHSSLLLRNFSFPGPIFLFQLPDMGPLDPNVEVWNSPRLVSSGDLAFAWLLKRGYRDFVSYGIGGTGYTPEFVPSRTNAQIAGHAKVLKKQMKNIRQRISAYNATWRRL